MDQQTIQPKGQPPTKVISLVTYKQNKQREELLARGRKPLYTSYSKSPPTQQLGTPPTATPPTFEERVGRIKASLEKINGLMADLKRLSRRNQFTD